jgi:GNAT superfamily N-acetyltransferase
MGDDVEIVRGGAELLDAVRPLWLAMRDHHGEIAPELGTLRGDDDSWRRRRAQYETWLQDPRAFVLLARNADGACIAYAFVRAEDGRSPTWEGEGSSLDLESLSVAPQARGTGVGGRLLALVREEVDRRGYDGLYITAVAANSGALRFYDREGFAPAFVILRDTRHTR